MAPSELKKLATLENKSADLGKEMEEAQRTASIAMRKEEGKPSLSVQRLINKGFKMEFLAFKAGDMFRDFKDTMRAKYL